MEIDDATTAPPTSTTEDVDSDCNNLLQEFSRMGTTDKDVLISKMQQLVNGLSSMESTFFLEMNNWNLEAAIWTYYEYSQAASNHLQSEPASWTAVKCDPNLCMNLVENKTVGNGEAVTPDTPFVTTWRLRNSGFLPWPEGTVLKFTDGTNLQGNDVTFDHIIMPSQEIDVTIQLKSPAFPGLYETQWRLHSNQQAFGDAIVIKVEVREGGVMAVTQQMDACHACE